MPLTRCGSECPADAPRGKPRAVFCSRAALPVSHRLGRCARRRPAALCAAGPNLNTISAPTQGKNTALIWAAYYGKESCVGMLLAWGADAAVEDEARPLSALAAAAAARSARPSAAMGGAFPAGWQCGG